MGSGNTKVKKIKKTVNNEEQITERHQKSLSKSVKSIDDSSPNSERSDNNNNGKKKSILKSQKDGDDWVGPGMIADDTRHGVTAADLMMGKQRLKPTRHSSNNNCNKALCDKNIKSDHYYPVPKPRLLHNVSTCKQSESHSRGNGTNTTVTSCTGMRCSTQVQIGTEKPQCCQGILPEVDRLALEVFGKNEVQQLCTDTKMAISQLTLQLRSNRQPLPAPRLSKSRRIKKILGFSSNNENIDSDKEKKSSLHLRKSRSRGQQLYDDYDVSLMAEIEREFGHCFG